MECMFTYVSVSEYFGELKCHVKQNGDGERVCLFRFGFSVRCSPRTLPRCDKEIVSSVIIRRHLHCEKAPYIQHIIQLSDGLSDIFFRDSLCNNTLALTAIDHTLVH